MDQTNVLMWVIQKVLTLGPCSETEKKFHKRGLRRTKDENTRRDGETTSPGVSFLEWSGEDYLTNYSCVGRVGHSCGETLHWDFEEGRSPPKIKGSEN